MKILIDLLIIYLIFSMGINLSGRFKRITFFLNIILFSGITGSIYEVVNGGGDYDNYRYMFQGVSFSEIPDDELGYYYLNLVIKLFTDEFAIAFLIFMVIINFFIIAFIYKYSNNIELSLLLYITIGGYITASNIVRQYMALAIYCYSIKYLLDKKYVRYFLLGVLAFQFHITVIIPVLLTILIKFLNNKISQNYLIYFFVINSFVIIEPTIRQIGLKIMGNGYENGIFFYGSSILHYLVQIIFFLFYLINIKKIKSSKTKLFINLATLSSIFTLLSNNMVLYARIASYFNIFHTIAVSNILFENNNIKQKRVFYYMILIGVYGYYYLLTSNSMSANNYIIDFFNSI